MLLKDTVSDQTLISHIDIIIQYFKQILIKKKKKKKEKKE
jgi:hypothetical protein